MLDIREGGISDFTTGMNAMFRLNCLIVCAGLAFGARIFAAETNSAASSMPSNQVNGYLQIQAQLHDTQLAIGRTANKPRPRPSATPTKWPPASKLYNKPLRPCVRVRLRRRRKRSNSC